MTRSIAVVNMSNWDGEDYVLRTRFKGSDSAQWMTVALKPGESHTFCPDDSEFEVKGKTRDKPPEPFHSAQGAALGGRLGEPRQMFPWLETGIGPDLHGSPGGDAVRLNFNPSEKLHVARIKPLAARLINEISLMPGSRNGSLAITNIEQGAMWAVKAATAKE